MSLKSWKAEFYPVTAGKCETDGSSDAGLAEHCLRKWQGAAPENLKRHNLRKTKNRAAISSAHGPGFLFVEETCALCARYASNCCEGCPLPKHMGEKVCGDINSPYDIFMHSGNADPMISALKKCVKELRREEKKK